MPTPDPSLDFDYLIVGGGAAGLSLAYHLSQEPRLVDKRVLLIEPETEPRHDRTWRFWTNTPGPFDVLAQHQWRQIIFRTPGFERTIPLGQYRYQMLRSLDFYQFVHQALAKRPSQFTRLTGRVRDLREQPNGQAVGVTLDDGQTLRAAYAFDSRLPKLDQQPTRYRYLLQHFLGWEVETEEDFFDVTAMQFMDFDVAQQQQTRFVYALPLSPRQALVEFTVFSAERLTTAEYEVALGAYLRQMLRGKPYRILSREEGAIPMTDHPLPDQVSPRILNLGTRAGRSKPSTGYTFARIQAHSARLVAALAATGAPPRNPAGDRWQFRLFDTLLLDIMQRRGELVRDLFRQLFTRNPIERIFRFLDERTSWWENLQIMRSVTPWPFLRSIWHVLCGRPGRR